jgi:Raf kinase inhibitor-like YbhB/YbcL family protein
MMPRTNFFFVAILFAGLLSSSCSNQAEPGSANTPKIQLTSAAFAEGQPIPDKYTGQGEDLSPPLQWSGAPAGAQSFALICEDPDAPLGAFTHWVVYNMPPATAALSENVPKTETLPDGTRQGKNGFGNIGYNGPAPPPGKTHHYYFRLYALDTVLNLDSGTTKNDVVSAMKGHVLAEGEAMGTYLRQ